jgi:hypothetical protein
MLLCGAALGALCIPLAERRQPQTADRVYGLALVVAAVVYVGFALVVAGGALKGSLPSRD